jgi:two-component system nitrate/nitrite response regulator NarL
MPEEVLGRRVVHTTELGESAVLSCTINLRTRKPRVLILSHVRLYREAMLMSLSRLENFELLGAEDLSRATVARVIGLQPDSIILDISAPESFAVAESLGISLPSAKIVAFAVSEIDRLVLACAEVGIAGYVSPDGSEQDLVTAIEYALRGELHCSPRVAGFLLQGVATLSGRLPRSGDQLALTLREREILCLLAEGMSNKEIARSLGIGGSTVKNHVHKILQKLEVHRRGEAAVRLRDMHLARQADAPTHQRRTAYVSSRATSVR